MDHRLPGSPAFGHPQAGPGGRQGTPAPRGQSLVEFALVLPVFLVLTIGIVDMARVFSANVNLADGVRKAALWAAEGSNYDRWCRELGAPLDAVRCPTQDTNGNAVDPSTKLSPDPPGPGNVAYELKSTGLDPTKVVMRAPTCSNPGDGAPAACASDLDVRVMASYPEALLTPVLGAILGGQILITQSTTARIEPSS